MFNSLNTTSNKITISRIFLAFIFVYFLYADFMLSKMIALLIFICASITDFLDGYLARKRNEVTEFGKFIDPIADKILVFGAFLAFIDLGLVFSWMVIIILSRDFIINGLRFLAAKKGRVLASNQLAKHKTVSQILVIFLVLSGLIIKNICINYFSCWNITYQIFFDRTIFFSMIIVVLLSLFSGIMYMYSNKDILKDRVI